MRNQEFDAPVNGRPLRLWPAGGVPELNPAWGDWAPTLTPHLLPGKSDGGIVIVFPGGGYNGRAEHERVPVAEWLNSEGFPSAILDYRVQNHNHPQPLGRGPWRDAQRAIRIVRSRAAEWKVRADRIAVLGFSAGGHLAAMVGTHFDAGNPQSADPVERASSRPDAMVLCYAAVLHHPVLEANLTGTGASEAEYAFYSCERHVTPDSTPAFLWHTADDAGVPLANSLRMTEVLRAAGVPAELHVFPSGPHGLGLAKAHPHVGQWRALCVNWLKSQKF